MNDKNLKIPLGSSAMVFIFMSTQSPVSINGNKLFTLEPEQHCNRNYSKCEFTWFFRLKFFTSLLNKVTLNDLLIW